MAGYFKGTLLASPVVRGSSGDTYGTHHSVLGVGGYMEVKTISERNAIPINNVSGVEFDGISSGQRRLGMLVHVLNDGVIYRLLPKISQTYITTPQWNAYNDSQKLNALNDNNNWYPLDLGGGSADITNIRSKIIQDFPNFSDGDVIGFDGTDFIMVTASNANIVEPLGFATNELNISGSTYEYTLVYAGYIDTTNILDESGNTLSAGTKYYLSNPPSLGNNLTSIEPIQVNTVSKPMLVALDNNSGIVLQYRGLEQTSFGVTQQVFNQYTGDTKIKLDASVTGATNIGYFTGFTGKQIIEIFTNNSSYNGFYESQYNYYYRDNNGIIRLGAPPNQPPRRGYVRTTPTPKKSWIYNTYTGSSNQVGWILVDGDINDNLDSFLTAHQYVGTSYQEVQWIDTGGITSNGSALALDVNGSLTTGSTYTMGGPVFRDKIGQTLNFRTLKSIDENALKISYDNNYIYFSGNTDGGTGTGGTQTYNLKSPSTVTVGGIPVGTTLTGLTSFELFEKLLVPEQFGTLTAPTMTTSLVPSTPTIYEIGYVIGTLNVNGTFNRGSITPQYQSASDKRAGNAISYVYTGSQVAGTYPSTSETISKTVTGYTVVQGSQTWGITVNHAAGVQPKGSDGTNYSSPYPAGSLSNTKTIVGAYPLFATTSDITSLDVQPLVDMSTANNIQINLVAESGGNKQKIDIPNAWTTLRPLVGIEQFNTVSSQWEYPGGSASTSLNLWTVSTVSHTIQGNIITYNQYTYNGVDRGTVNIRLNF